VHPIFRRAVLPVLAAAALAGCGGASGTTATGVISTVHPALCIARDEAEGVCVPGADPEGLAVGDCVTFTYTGQSGAPTAIRDIRIADPAAHPDDCPPG
jgi:hypothetical protein